MLIQLLLIFYSSTSGLSQSSSSMSASVRERLRFDDSVFFRSPNADESDHRRSMKRTASLSSAVPGLLRMKSARFDPLGNLESTTANATNNSTASGTVRKRYPSFEEHDVLRQELEKAKMELVKKEAERIAAENDAKRSQGLVDKMELSIRSVLILNPCFNLLIIVIDRFTYRFC